MKNYNKIYNEPKFETAEFMEETVYEPAPQSIHSFGKVNAREVYIRKGPGTDFEPVGTVKEGDELIIISHQDNFLEIETEDGTHAYIMESFVDID